MLSLSLGSSAISLGVLLGTFMGGMCLGSLLLPQFVPASRHPVRVYAQLEAGIGVMGLIILFVLPYAGGLYTTIGGPGFGGLLVRGLIAALCLLPPTLLMGATLPAIARYVSATPSGVSWLGFFYGGNIVGAVFGTLLAGLLPAARPRRDVRDVRRRRDQLRRRGPGVLLREEHAAHAAASSDTSGSRLEIPTGSWPVYVDHRPVRHDRVRRRGGLDAPADAAARRHGLHVLAHPRGLPHRARASAAALAPRSAKNVKNPRNALGIVPAAAGGGTGVGGVFADDGAARTGR